MEQEKKWAWKSKVEIIFACSVSDISQLGHEHRDQVQEKAGGTTKVLLRHCLLERFGSSELKTF